MCMKTVSDWEGPAKGLPGDQEVPRDEVQDAEGEREAGEAAALRYLQKLEQVRAGSIYSFVKLNESWPDKSYQALND